MPNPIPSPPLLDHSIYVPFTFADIGVPVSSTRSIPAAVTVICSSVVITTPFAGGVAPTIAVEVYNMGGSTSLQATTDNNPALAGQYDVDTAKSVTNTGPVKVTLGGTAGAGAGYCLVRYTIPLT